VFEAHDHADVEECLVMPGDLLIGERHLKAGDYQVAAPGTRHPPLKSDAAASSTFAARWRLDENHAVCPR
jgi:hypothetical protein